LRGLKISGRSILLSLILAILFPVSSIAQTSPYTYSSWVTGYVDRGLMADGNYVYEGAAACPYWIPFGTKIDIENIGVLTCEDRGPNWFDVWRPTVQECYQLTGQYRWRYVNG